MHHVPVFRAARIGTQLLPRCDLLIGPSDPRRVENETGALITLRDKRRLADDEENRDTRHK